MAKIASADIAQRAVALEQLAARAAAYPAGKAPQSVVSELDSALKALRTDIDKQEKLIKGGKSWNPLSKKTRNYKAALELKPAGAMMSEGARALTERYGNKPNRRLGLQPSAWSSKVQAQRDAAEGALQALKGGDQAAAATLQSSIRGLVATMKSIVAENNKDKGEIQKFRSAAKKYESVTTDTGMMNKRKDEKRLYAVTTSALTQLAKEPNEQVEIRNQAESAVKPLVVGQLTYDPGFAHLNYVTLNTNSAAYPTVGTAANSVHEAATELRSAANSLARARSTIDQGPANITKKEAKLAAATAAQEAAKAALATQTKVFKQEDAPLLRLQSRLETQYENAESAAAALSIGATQAKRNLAEARSSVQAWDREVENLEAQLDAARNPPRQDGTSDDPFASGPAQAGTSDDPFASGPAQAGTSDDPFADPAQAGTSDDPFADPVDTGSIERELGRAEANLKQAERHLIAAEKQLKGFQLDLRDAITYAGRAKDKLSDVKVQRAAIAGVLKGYRDSSTSATENRDTAQDALKSATRAIASAKTTVENAPGRIGSTVDSLNTVLGEYRATLSAAKLDDAGRKKLAALGDKLPTAVDKGKALAEVQAGTAGAMRLVEMVGGLPRLTESLEPTTKLGKAAVDKQIRDLVAKTVADTLAGQ